MNIDKCFVCQGDLEEIKGKHYRCLKCGRDLVYDGECWTTLPRQVSVDFSKFKEGDNYSDAVKPID